MRVSGRFPGREVNSWTTFTPARSDQTGCHSGVCRALQSAASFRLHDSEEIADMKIAVEFGLFLARQFALASQLRQLVHACDIALAKTNRHQIFGCAAR